MDVKKTMLDQVGKLMQNPRVMQMAMNPRVMGAVMKAMSLRGQVASTVASATQSMARTLNLASRDDVRELRRTVRRLEEQLSRMEYERDEAGAPDDER